MKSRTQRKLCKQSSPSKFLTYGGHAQRLGPNPSSLSRRVCPCLRTFCMVLVGVIVVAFVVVAFGDQRTYFAASNHFHRPITSLHTTVSHAPQITTLQPPRPILNRPFVRLQPSSQESSRVLPRASSSIGMVAFIRETEYALPPPTFIGGNVEFLSSHMIVRFGLKPTSVCACAGFHCAHQMLSQRQFEFVGYIAPFLL